MIEPIIGNVSAHGRYGIESEAEKVDNMIEPLKGNRPIKGRSNLHDTEIQK
jgi:hypothetical protein